MFQDWNASSGSRHIARLSHYRSSAKGVYIIQLDETELLPCLEPTCNQVFLGQVGGGKVDMKTIHYITYFKLFFGDNNSDISRLGMPHLNGSRF